MRKRTTWATGLAIAAVVATGASTVAASAQENPHQRGPEPTESLIDGDGPFRIATENVPNSVRGFGGGKIYYPTDTSEGDFGGVAVSPGFFSPQFIMAGISERMASHGFVVISIETNTILDFPDSRAEQLQAALRYLTQESPVADRVDASRLAVSGHSMGGGGTLRAAQNNPQLQAAVPLAPWHLEKNFGSTQVPTFVVGGESDLIAPVADHSEPFYESLPASVDKAYLELAGANHFFPNSFDATMAKYAVSWLKRFVDNDTRYEQFLCPAPSGGAISEYRDTCPHS